MTDRPYTKAYLDIETSYSGYITVLGIFRPPDDLIQMVYPDIGESSLLGALDGAEEVITYWGHRFDLPVICRVLGINLRDMLHSTDLADRCHRHGLYGGLKQVEKELGIPRRTEGMSGTEALMLWERWCDGDARALKRLLKYNEDDVVNLYLLEKELCRLDEAACERRVKRRSR
jgi:uncharacterized protein YprB with RNaseH-like and TPR domain